MPETDLHIFPEPQAEYLRALRDGRYRPAERSRRYPSRVTLASEMPPVYQQALQGTCVASAVTALLEYYGDCRTRLSVQYLYAVTKEIERAGLERNLAALAAGESLDPRFEACFHAELLQLRMLADANGGLSASAVRPYVIRFEEGVRTRFNVSAGSLLCSCFHAVETRGTCRYALWPYAAARATPMFSSSVAHAVYPPGTHEDAVKHRVLSGLYLFGTPNNVDEIRGILAGANGRRPMPVVVTVNFFAGCDGETYSFPSVEETAEGALATADRWCGRHGLLIVGYEDDTQAPGGGWFLIRNSLGEGWGRAGYGRLPYGYLECFAVEAGTILQDMVDYLGDGYDGQRVPTVETARPAPKRPRWLVWLINILIAIGVAIGTIIVGVYFDDPLGLRPPGTSRRGHLSSPPPSAASPARPMPVRALPAEKTPQEAFRPQIYVQPTTNPPTMPLRGPRERTRRTGTVSADAIKALLPSAQNGVKGATP